MKDKITKVIKEAGNIIINAGNIFENIESKQGDDNFVTLYDKKVQEFLFDELQKLFPDAEFIGEEDIDEKSQVKVTSNLQFIIDPIDGTTNFIFGYQHSAISVALMKNGEVIEGYVYNPFLDEMFSAIKGQGSYLNDKKIKVEDRSIKDGLACFGTAPYYSEYIDKTMIMVRKLLENSLDIRRSGSAALDICYVACNKVSIFAEYVLAPWDHAAAALILKEAGGTITNIDKKPLPYQGNTSVMAGNPISYEEFFKL